MWTELAHIVRHASADPDIRVLVLSSTSDAAFTAGLDRVPPLPLPPSTC